MRANYVYKLTNGELVDITLDAPNNPDTINHTIKGVITEHFCTFLVGIANRAPVANAGIDQILECTSLQGVDVVLDGSASYDPDENITGLEPSNTATNGRTIISYTWTGDFGTVTGVNPKVILPIGVHKITLTVSDGLLETSDEVIIIVKYKFTGFFQPIDMGDKVFNVAKAGSAIPIKFSLNGYMGMNIFASGYPKAIDDTYDPTASYDDIEVIVTSGKSGLSYDSGSVQYTYVWKTDEVWAGKYKQLVVKLVDGTVITANFKFK
ncbi:MAG: PxKF domain-containing protein [Clostridiales bacterium]|nr:PxKF domain-containing protein [Clostridiales bacterium]